MPHGREAAPSADGPSARPEPEAEKKAAHRLPTGAYPAVDHSSSLRPRSEPEPEPADLFRPARGPATPDAPKAGTPAVDQAAARRGEQSETPKGAASTEQPTTAVGAVRPKDATTDSGKPAGGGTRPTSPSRSA